MKLRLRGNSIRIRLMQQDVEDLIMNQSLDESVELASGNFGYQLVIGDDFNAIFEKGYLVVSIPEAIAKPWSQSEELSIDHFLDLAEDKKLRILVEKDLKCQVDRPHEDESDAFPNSNGGC